MKKLIVFATLCLPVLFANAQKLKETDVPARVKSAFVSLYPTIKDVKWEKEKGHYEANYKDAKGESSVLMDATGTVLERETAIAVNELPKGVTDYMDKNLPGTKIKESSKITDSKGKVTYEAGVKGMDYVFDEKGNFIKKEKD